MKARLLLCVALSSVLAAQQQAGFHCFRGVAFSSGLGARAFFAVFAAFVVRVSAFVLLAAFKAAARSIMRASIAPASPPAAGRPARFVTQTAGVSSARMSSKSPSLLTLFGANSVMS